MRTKRSSIQNNEEEIEKKEKKSKKKVKIRSPRHYHIKTTKEPGRKKCWVCLTEATGHAEQKEKKKKKGGNVHLHHAL